MWKPLLLSLSTIAVLPAAEPPAYPPYDAKKSKAIQDGYRAHLEKHTRQAYRTVGKRDAKWDKLVEAMFDANTERVAGVHWRKVEAEVKQRDLLRKAVEAGCDDPLVWFYMVRLTPAAEAADTDDDRRELLLEAVKALDESKYPAARKAEAWLAVVTSQVANFRVGKPSPENIEAATAAVDKAAQALADVAAEPGPAPRVDALAFAKALHQLGRPVGKRTDWFKKIDAHLAKRPAGDPLADAIRGEYFVSHAWDARGDGVGATVTPTKGKLFSDRLATAEKHLTAAWEADKQFAEPAADMIRVCIGRAHDRETMESWFRRAIEASPDNMPAHMSKLSYLEPKWHGTPEDILAFARQVAAIDRWDTPYPLMMAQAHQILAMAVGKHPGKYFPENPTAWDDFAPALETLRKKHPESIRAASIYLYYSWTCDKNGPQAKAYLKAQKLTNPVGPFVNKAEIDAARIWLLARGDDADKTPPKE